MSPTSSLQRHLAMLVTSVALVPVWLPPTSAAAAVCDPVVATVVAAEGQVDARRTHESQWQPVKRNDTFCAGDMIRVQERSRADVALVNQPLLRLDQNTTVTLGGIRKEGGSLIDLAKGALHFISRLRRNLEVRTAFVNAGVEGTEGFLRVEEDRTLITIFDGRVVASNQAGNVTLTDGQSAVAEAGKAPVLRVVVRPRDAVHWALYYPPVMDPGAVPKEDLNDPRFLAYRAEKSLAVGRVGEATADLDRALQIDPNNADAMAIQSIIAVVQNDKDKALTLALKAIEADPRSASARTALSYAQQARFDLDSALKNLKEAVRVSPNDALAWARLAELQLSLGDLDDALRSAEKAVELNPNLSRTQTVLGFALLLKVNTGQAKEAFTKAIDLDQADSLPRLGLGLAKFREGDVEEGRRDMEVAASLDPNNAIIRSYLGKAYFEEKRDQENEREFTTAKELDPKDPTPFFYHALQKQLTNRPVEALKDMEKAIALNENRAVYRGRLQLDSDAAARSSSLGRIYIDLGLDYLALVEGWNSLNTDPTNFSAARLLADTYASLPRHEVARVSELLRSQLLQPVNITPIQPSLAISNLFLLSALGPTSTSFNEFNTLMVNRDRLTFLGSGLYGDNSTSSGEGVVAGIYKKFSFSVGYYNFRTDGWRPNATQRDGNVNVFMQYEFSPKTMIQGEYRYRNVQSGDLQQRFFNNDFDHSSMNALTANTFRLGGRHTFTPNSILLANFAYVKSSELLNVTDPVAPPTTVGPFTPVNLSFVQIDGKQFKRDSYTAEVQHLFRSQYVNFATGLGYAHQNGHPPLRVNVNLSPFLGPGFENFSLVNQPIPFLVRHYNGYAYSYLKPFQNLTLTAGLSYDYLQGSNALVAGTNDTNTKDSVNPKFGLVYNPFPGTTIRAAAFKVMKRTFTNDQTIEPTQVAGFNQFFDDFNGTHGWRYGAAINQKITDTLFAGVEGSYREFDTPAISVLDPTSQFTNQGDEYQALGYLFYAPHPWVVLRASYYYDQVTNTLEQASVFPRKLYTSRVPLGIGFFHPSGLIANLTLTYWNQMGTFRPLAAPVGTQVSGSDTFWLTDLALGYRFPKRYGLITVGIKNLFDQQFNFFNIDPRNPFIMPGRMAFFKVTLALP